MAHQSFFKRYEIKYLISLEQKKIILEAIKPYLELDKYGRTTIRNIYFDTPNYRLIRRSIERPLYKEKLRIRCYEQVNEDSMVFVEMKKKYNSIVYKRRVLLPLNEATSWISSKEERKDKNQIINEIQYFINYYEDLKPAIFLSYEREAYYALDNSDLRITFDENILFRTENIDLTQNVYGDKILEDGYSIMEIKYSKWIPLWLTKILSKEKIYKTRYSKYGTAYKHILELNSKRGN